RLAPFRSVALRLAPVRSASLRSAPSRWASDSNGEKKQRTWPDGPVSRRFGFSKLVSEGLIRENAFESGYRERELSGIAWSLPKALKLLDYHRLRERL